MTAYRPYQHVLCEAGESSVCLRTINRPSVQAQPA
jgi:hypothetical protein